jgi:hypothetical protein
MATAPFTLSAVGQRLYDMFEPMAEVDDQQDFALAVLCSAAAAMFDEVGGLMEPTSDGLPWESKLFDPDVCPAFLLPWLAQFVGVTLPPGLTESQQRLRINETDGVQRGRPVAIKGAARQFLTGTKSVTLYERIGGSPYEYLVITYAAETAAAATVGLLESSFATVGDVEAEFATVGQLEAKLSPGASALAAALLAAKPGGYVFTHRIDDGWSVGQLEAAYAGRTIGDLETDYATIGALETHLP